MTHLNTLIWDIGGVLLRTHDWSSRHKWDARLNLPQGAVEETVFNSHLGRLAQHGEVTTEQHWENLRNHLGLTREEIALLRRDFWAGDRFDQQLADEIRGWRAAGWRTGVISNAFDDLRQVLTEEFGVGDAFDTLTVSAEEGIMKPEAAIYQRTLERLRVSAEQALFIDDSEINIAGGTAVGLHTLHFQSPTQLFADLAKMGITSGAPPAT